MKKTLFDRLTALALVLVLAVAMAMPASAAYDMPIETSMADETVYLVNLDDGTVLLDQNSAEPRYVASLTKMMTALLVLESGEDLEKTITVPDSLTQEFKDIQNANGSDMRLVIGEEVRLIDLMYGLLVSSANDAASVLADYFGSGSISAFVDQMNQKAAALGCTQTKFSCPHGLYDQGNVSTAQDLVKIATACWKNPKYMEIANTTKYTVPANNKHDQPRDLETTNLMMVPDGEYYREGISGVKTGFTTLAGRCYVTTASHEGHNYMLAILGSKKEKKNERFYIYPEANAIFDWAFARYSDRTLLSKGEKVGEVALRGCDESKVVTLHADTELVKNAYDDASLTVEIEAPEELKAPIKEGEALGTAIVKLDGSEVGRVSLIADKKYESALLKGSLSAIALVPAVLVVVAALGYLTAQLSHSQVNFAALFRKRRPQARGRRRATSHR